MRRYDDPVEVRRGMVGAEEAPEQFLWRGRLWKVRAVLAHWVETGAWWSTVGSAGKPEGGGAGGVAGGATTDLLAERELWRVEAGSGRGAASDAALAAEGGAGVFELALDWSDGSWQLVGCLD